MEIVKNERNKNAAQYFRPQTTQRDEFYNIFSRSAVSTTSTGQLPHRKNELLRKRSPA